MVLTSAWVSDSARRKQPSASRVKSTCSPTAPPSGNCGTRLERRRLLVVRKGEIMLVNGILMATSWLLTLPDSDAKAEPESISPTSNTAKPCSEGEVCGKPADRCE